MLPFCGQIKSTPQRSMVNPDKSSINLCPNVLTATNMRLWKKKNVVCPLFHICILLRLVLMRWKWRIQLLMPHFHACHAPRSPVNKHWYQCLARKYCHKGCHEICLSSCRIVFNWGYRIMMAGTVGFVIKSVFRCFHSLTPNTPVKCGKKCYSLQKKLM